MSEDREQWESERDVADEQPPARLDGVEVSPVVNGATIDPRDVSADAFGDDEYLSLTIPVPQLGVIETIELAIPRSRLLAILGGAS
ncbi:hypothetical protein MYK68_14145 [Gordonia sp. PP30]|uniref:hypothetical protein n=1 Tax=Gordonia sp. PP30 TaxID=2935861 RepID=UPI001FFF630E|nr:hypothetical protein [Gordonia sp. PP30]UQE73872.1 hypothetical protein MYK68_14145 [Gordonia sp. PP30]